MNKDIVKKILTGKIIEITELNTFISEYTHERLNRDITTEELNGIRKAIEKKFFNLRFAAMEAAKIMKLNVMDTFGKDGKWIKTEVYESN